MRPEERQMAEFMAMVLSVFVAELGDKTQLAVLLFAAAGKQAPLTVFLAASLALVASTALAVGLGHLGGTHLSGLPLRLIGGLGFLALGAWMVYGHLTGAS